MSEDHEHTGIDLDIPSWVWWTALGLAAGCVVLMALWYVRNPDRSPLVDFARRVPTAPETQQINRKAEEIVKESVPLLEQVFHEEASHGV